MFFHRKNTRNL